METEVHQSNDNSESTDTSSCGDRVLHTLPVRKIKKRMDISSVKSVAQASNCRANIKNVFNQKVPCFPEEQKHEEDHDYHEPNLLEPNGAKDGQPRFLPRLQGVENAAFQKQESPQKTEATESEVYFADVSSCCNISVRNDGQDSSLYDEATDNQKPRLTSLQCTHKQSKIENVAQNNQMQQNFQEFPTNMPEDEEYLVHRLGKRQMSTRSRLPFPLPDNEEIAMQETNENCNLSKDISTNSLCSSVQTPRTETSDLSSPVSPSFSKSECCLGYFPDKTITCEQLQKPRKMFVSNIDEYLAPDAQYEVIQENSSQSTFRHNFGGEENSCNLTNTISGLNNFGQNYLTSAVNNFNQNNFIPNVKNFPPKTLNIGQTSRRNIGSNISTLIQNLGGNPVGLLYGEANSAEDEEIQGQGCHSDGTMDSGWQSGSEKQDKTEPSDSCDTKPVNV